MIIHLHTVTSDGSFRSRSCLPVIGEIEICDNETVFIHGKDGNTESHVIMALMNRIIELESMNSSLKRMRD